MVKSVLIICDQSPIGKNLAAEAIRLGSGLIAYGDSIDCKVVYRDDAVYFLSKSLEPEAVNMDPITPTIRLMELSDIEVYALKESLDRAGLNRSDLIGYDNLEIINEKELANFILNSEATFRF